MTQSWKKRDPRDPPTPSRSIVNDDQMVDSESELIRKSEYAHQGDPGGTTHPLNIKVEQKEAHSSSQEIELESLSRKRDPEGCIILEVGENIHSEPFQAGIFRYPNTRLRKDVFVKNVQERFSQCTGTTQIPDGGTICPCTGFAGSCPGDFERQR